MILAGVAVFGICFAVYVAVITKIKSVAGRPDDRRAAAVILVFAALFRLPFLLTTPSLSDDIYRYLWDGRVQLSGINPYVYPPSAPELASLRTADHAFINHPDLRTVYPPLAEWLFRFGAAIRPTIGTQRLIFLAFDVATIVVLLLWLRAVRRSAWLAAIYAWNPLVVVEFAGSGHNDSAMLFFVALACLMYAHQRKAGAAASLAGAVLAKWIPLVAIPWLIVRREYRSLAIFSALIVLGCLPFASGVWRMLHAFSPAVSGLATYARDWIFNPSLYAVVDQTFSNPLIRRSVVGTVLTFFAFWWARDSGADLVRYLFGVLFALLLAGPVVHPWYVTWIVPFLCFYPLWSGIVWSGVVFLTYVVLVRYRADGVWQLPAWVGWLEYSAVYLLLAKEMTACRLRFSSPR